MLRWLAVILIALTGPGVGSAAEMRSIDVQYEDGYYTLVSVVWFDAGVRPMFDVFSTWDLSDQFSGAVVEARDLEADELGRPGFFEEKVLRAFADPALSDFKVSNEAWEFAEEGSGTVVKYTLHMQPDFWVPPAIGPYLIKRKLKSDGGRALDRIEAIAKTYGDSGGMVVD
jgi:hypothetical protein